MKNKNKLKKIITFILIVIILCINFFLFKYLIKTQKIKNELFQKELVNQNSNNKFQTIVDNHTYKLKIGDKDNVNLKSIDLAQTIDSELLTNGKVAPGASGYFCIMLESNKKLKYKIEFASENNQPQNLNFKAYYGNELISKTNTLDELSSCLSGDIRKNEKINITIYWSWKFEGNNEKSDIQDTEDAKRLKKYKFNILAYGVRNIREVEL